MISADLSFLAYKPRPSPRHPLPPLVRPAAQVNLSPRRSYDHEQPLRLPILRSSGLGIPVQDTVNSLSPGHLITSNRSPMRSVDYSQAKEVGIHLPRVLKGRFRSKDRR